MAEDKICEEDFDSRLEQLKEAVLMILEKYPEGIKQTDLWPLVEKHSGRPVSAEFYCLSEMSKALELWKDVIKVDGNGNQKQVCLKSSAHTDREKETNEASVNQSAPAAATSSFSAEDQPLPSTSFKQHSKGHKRKHNEGDNISSVLIKSDQEGQRTGSASGSDASVRSDQEEPGNVDGSHASVESDQKDRLKTNYERLLPHMSSLKSWVLNYMTANKNKKVPVKKLKNFLQGQLRQFKLYSLPLSDVIRLLEEEFQDTIFVDEDSVAHLKTMSIGGDMGGSSELTKEEKIRDYKEKLTEHSETIQTWLIKFLRNHKSVVKEKKLTKHLNGKINKYLGLLNIFHRFSSEWFYTELCSGIIYVEPNGKVCLIE